MGKNDKPDVSHFDDRLAKTYSKEEDKEKHYDKWAATYETDLVDDLGYIAHRDASEILIQYVPNKSNRILDVACGTGLVGECLQNAGYTNVDGVDFSREMLTISEQRGVYRKLWQQDFTQSAEINDLYDSLICVGMFSYSIPRISDMHNVINCVKPDGLCVITVNGAAWRDLNLGEQVDAEMAAHGYNHLVTEKAGYIENEGIDSRILVVRR